MLDLDAQDHIQIHGTLGTAIYNVCLISTMRNLPLPAKTSLTSSQTSIKETGLLPFANESSRLKWIKLGRLVFPFP